MRPCSRWGLPCRSRCRERGGLLPRRFTLARRLIGTSGRAVCFLWHSPRGHPHRALPGTLLSGARTFLPLPSRRCRADDRRLPDLLRLREDTTPLFVLLVQDCGCSSRCSFAHGVVFV